MGVGSKYAKDVFQRRAVLGCAQTQKKTQHNTAKTNASEFKFQTANQFTGDKSLSYALTEPLDSGNCCVELCDVRLGDAGSAFCFHLFEPVDKFAPNPFRIAY